MNDAKRLFDIALAGTGLTVLAPVMLICAVAVRVTSPGPIFFRQERVGRHGNPFVIHKFRSMRVNDSSNTLSPTGDRRVTRVGRFLRRTKLDELPQLFDVLRGAMSMVGPRPEIAKFVDFWPPGARAEILELRPGITDPGSIRFRNEADLLRFASDPEEYYRTVIIPEKVDEYLKYCRGRSFLGDVRILVRTVIDVTGH